MIMNPKIFMNFDKKIIKVDFYEYSDYEKEMIYKEWKKIKDIVKMVVKK